MTGVLFFGAIGFLVGGFAGAAWSIIIFICIAAFADALTH